MTPEFKLQLCDEIDAFLAAVKYLCGLEPTWARGSRRNQLVGIWRVMEEGRDGSRAYLVFSIFSTARDQPSVSLIYRKWEVCRIDVKQKYSVRDMNPDFALRFGLPKVIDGTHIHLWEYNRDYLKYEMLTEKWSIPNKMPISQSTRTLRQILPCICTHCGIYLAPEQRVIYPPKRKEFHGV